MKVDLSPFARDRMAPEAIKALEDGPAGYQMSVSRGRSGFGATVIRRTSNGYDVLADVNGFARPEQAIEAAMEAARPHPKAVA
jgi:hypothetical protein